MSHTDCRPGKPCRRPFIGAFSFLRVSAQSDKRSEYSDPSLPFWRVSCFRHESCHILTSADVYLWAAAGSASESAAHLLHRTPQLGRAGIVPLSPTRTKKAALVGGRAAETRELVCPDASNRG